MYLKQVPKALFGNISLLSVILHKVRIFAMKNLYTTNETNVKIL